MNCVEYKNGSEKWFVNSRWIGETTGFSQDETFDKSPCMRKVFTVNKGVKNAKIALCGLGLYHFLINGKRPTKNVVMPLYTEYNKRTLYDVIDITEFLHEGDNCISFILGNGFYNVESKCAWDFNKASWRGIQKLIFDLKIEYQNGETQSVVSDNSVKVAKSPVTYNCIRNGCTYDARLVQNGWCFADFDDSNWSFAEFTKPSGILHENTAPAIVECETFSPVSITTLDNGHKVYDIGQNIAGYVRMSGTGKKGTTVVFRYGEILDDNGNVSVENVSNLVEGDFQVDRYIFGDEKVENWSPLFVYHGFRYIEVEIIGEADIELCGVAIRSGFAQIADFSCSDDYLNRVWNAVLWSDKSNFVGFPTDCPQREKNGWTSEAFLATERLISTFDAVKALKKWLDDVRDAQLPTGELPCIIPGPGWGLRWANGITYDSSLAYIPYLIYKETGDTSSLLENYDAIKAYIKYQENFLRDDFTIDNSIEDWLSIDIDHPCPSFITATSYFYSACIIVSKIANILGDTETESYYKDLAKTVKTHFNRNFVNGETGKIGDSEYGVQTAQCVPLYHGIVAEENRAAVAKYLKESLKVTDGHIATGTYGTKAILEVLSFYGYIEDAYTMATIKGYPGWHYMFENGATTLWEEWGGGKVVEWSGSHNHNALCSVGDWLYRYVAGLKQAKDSVAYNKIEFCPALQLPINSVSYKHETVKGLAAISWCKKGDVAEIEICVPKGSEAVLTIPKEYKTTNTVFSEGKHTIILQKA